MSFLCSVLLTADSCYLVRVLCASFATSGLGRTMYTGTTPMLLGCALAATASRIQGFILVPAATSSLLVVSAGIRLPTPAAFSQYRQARATAPRTLRMGKGFGPPPPKKNPKPKSPKRAEKDAAAKAYDDMAAAGIPEYNIFIKPKGTDDYLPAGVMAVPRSQQVSQAVFEQEENLKKAAFRFYSKLKEFEEFEYGYTLKMFPDDPITPIEVRAPSGNAFSRFFEGLLSPVNTQGMKGPEINPPKSK